MWRCWDGFASGFASWCLWRHTLRSNAVPFGGFGPLVVSHVRVVVFTGPGGIWLQSHMECCSQRSLDIALYLLRRCLEMGIPGWCILRANVEHDHNFDLAADTSLAVVATLRRLVQLAYAGGLRQLAWQTSRCLSGFLGLSTRRQACLLYDSKVAHPSVLEPRWQSFSSDRASVQQRACSVPFALRESLRNIDNGFQELQQFWTSFAENFRMYCLGDVGVSHHMQAIFKAMSIAWWLPDVANLEQPEPHHIEALQSLYTFLKNDIRRRPWPAEDYDMTPPVRRWPNQLGLTTYYRVWWSSVHTEAHRPEGPFFLAWRHTTGHVVEPIKASPMVLKLCKRFWPSSSCRFLRFKIAGLVSNFLFESAPSRFWVSCREVRWPGGDLGVLCSRRLKRHVVRFISSTWEWDQRKIAASLEQDGRFARNCYHINSLFCMSRRFGSTEAPVETWVSELKYLHNPVQGPTTTTIATRLRARMPCSHTEPATRRCAI